MDWGHALSPLEYYQKFKIPENRLPSMKKWLEGMKIHFAEKGVVVNTIRDCPPEFEYIDALEEEDLYPDPAEFDMNDLNQKAQYEHKCRLSAKYVKICESRNEIMINLRSKFPAKTVERAQSRNIDAFNSYFTPLSVYVEMLMEANFSGERNEYTKVVKNQVNNIQQDPGEDDDAFISRAQGYFDNARILELNQTEEDYVHKIMLGLNSSWKFLSTMYAIQKDNMHLTKIKDVQKLFEDYAGQKTQSDEDAKFIEVNEEVVVNGKKKYEKKGEKKGEKKDSNMNGKKDSKLNGKKQIAEEKGAEACLICLDDSHKAYKCPFQPAVSQLISTLAKKKEQQERQKKARSLHSLLTNEAKDTNDDDDSFEKALKDLFVVFDAPEEKVFSITAEEQETWVILDTGASVNLFCTSFGKQITEGQEITLRSVHGQKTLSKVFQHEIFGTSYYDPDKKINVVAAKRILTDGDLFKVDITSDGMRILFTPPDGKSMEFTSVWRHGVLMFDHQSIKSIDDQHN